ncbi:MAG TPA: TonB family protein [Terriglobales bacterium]|nr:TonB family protein [Terriglobales bacterium]
MSETWKQWEGRTVDGRFPLQSYLGGSDHSAVFLALMQSAAGDSQKAAIKLISAGAVDAEKQLLRWQAARDLNHPNLIRIFEAGRCRLDSADLLYVVEEYAEENLSQILPERALTVEEVRTLLPPVLKALQFVHEKGFVHGHIQPSNILAIGDQVKLSSDALSVPGEENLTGGASAYDPPEALTAMGAVSTAGDVWRLGMTLVEVLTQRIPVWDVARGSAPEIPAAVPEPFREIAGRCLQVDAEKRWTIAEISDRLSPARVESARPRPAATQMPATAEQRKESTKWPYWLGLAALVALAIFLIARPKTPGPPMEVKSTQATQGAAAENPQSATKTTNADNQSGVVRRVMPQVSPSARSTIQGKIKVRVKVEVDAAGNVADATLESAGPSKYFSRSALEAAQGWKFAPAQAGEQGAAREWKLQFTFSRNGTEAAAARTRVKR